MEANVGYRMKLFPELKQVQKDTPEYLFLLEDTLENIRDNYDHDPDAHRYNTPCRVCTAEQALEGIVWWNKYYTNE